MEANKKAALEFYDLAINKRDFEAASKYIGTDYRQHNPLVGDGKEGFKAFLAMLKQNFPESHSEVSAFLRMEIMSSFTCIPSACRTRGDARFSIASDLTTGRLSSIGMQFRISRRSPQIRMACSRLAYPGETQVEWRSPWSAQACGKLPPRFTSELI